MIIINLSVITSSVRIKLSLTYRTNAECNVYSLYHCFITKVTRESAKDDTRGQCHQLMLLCQHTGYGIKVPIQKAILVLKTYGNEDYVKWCWNIQVGNDQLECLLHFRQIEIRTIHNNKCFIENYHTDGPRYSWAWYPRLYLSMDGKIFKNLRETT